MYNTELEKIRIANREHNFSTGQTQEKVNLEELRKANQEHDFLTGKKRKTSFNPIQAVKSFLGIKSREQIEAEELKKIEERQARGAKIREHQLVADVSLGIGDYSR